MAASALARSFAMSAASKAATCAVVMPDSWVEVSAAAWAVVNDAT